MLAFPVDSHTLMRALYAIEPYCTSHGEISEAIARAANQDPLFPNRYDGCYRTAAILIALAWYGSRFQPTIVTGNGQIFGLYGIRPPKTDARGKPITSNILTNPHDASLIVIDLVRQSMMADKKRVWEERLFSYCDGQKHDSPMHQSLSVMLLADEITKNHFPKEMRALPPPMPET